MNRIVKSLSLAVLALVVLCGCKEDIVEDVKVSLNKSVLTLDKGATEQLKATLSPASAKVDVSWTSSDNSVASVTSDGSVTGTGAGEAVITVKADKASATCKVVVRPSAVEEVVLDKTELTMQVGEKTSLKATVLPDDADDASVSWKSLNDKVVTVDAKGSVEALAPGNATVVAEAGGKVAQCRITVETPVINVESVKIVDYVETLVEGATFVFTAKVLPEDATDRSVVWESSNNEVMTIDGSGKATAVEAGTVEISVKTNDGGKTDKCVVIVEPAHIPVERVQINDVKDEETIQMNKGEEMTLTATVYPEDASDKTVTWSVSDEKVLSVDNGKVKALAGGTAKVIVRTTDGGKTDECEINVVVPVEKVEIVTQPEGLSMVESSSFVFTAKVTPDDATDKTVVWTSEDPSVLAIDASTGKADALKPGKSVVKASAGNVSAECTVTVVKGAVDVESVKIIAYPSDDRMVVGTTFVFKAEVKPDDADDKTVVWVSSDSDVLRINESGVAVAMAAGEVTVSASCGGKTDVRTITVDPATVHVESVQITSVPEGNEMTAGESFRFEALVRPADAADKTVVWTSSDKEVLTIAEDGLATAVSAGEATVTVTTNDGAKTDECKIKVNPSVVSVESVKIIAYPSSYQMNVGDTFTFEATVSPADADNKALKWSSSDSDVISIDASGNAKALAAGTADITVTSEDGGKTDKVAITVKVPHVAVTSVELVNIPAGNKMKVGETFTFTAKVLPDNATDKSVVWKSTDDRIISIDANGKATAVGAGSASISVTTVDGSKMSKTLVTVVNAGSEIPVSSVTLVSENGLDELRHGKTMQLIPNYSPSGSYPGESKWYSNDESLATVDANGLVKAVNFDYSQPHSYYLQNGYPTVTITHMADNISAIFKIKILPAVPEKIVVPNPPPTSLLLGQSWDMGDIYILPAEAEQKVTIISTYDGQFGGEIGSSFTASKVGVMNILITAMGEHAQTVYTGTSVNYTINVSPIKETSVVMNRTSYTIEEGSEFDISCNVLPSNATYKDLTWESSNSSVATVAGGRVKALSAGTATITAKSYHGVRASCTVTVKARTTAVSVGDYYYSDGTTSSELQSGKTPVGIVFALADPVGSDPATLGKDHSGCTHGLVVGLKSYRTPFASSAFIDDYPLNVVSANAASAGMLNMTSRTVMCGYSNTKALKNWGSWLVIDVCNDHAAEYQLPSSTSGWYFPSLGEMELLGDNYSIVNEKLKAIDESYAIGAGLEFWVSTYFGVPTNSYTYIISEGGLAADVRQGVTTGAAMLSSDTRYARYIFAF